MRISVVRFSILLLLAFTTQLFAQQYPKYLALQEQPPLVPIQMRRPGFWISRHPAPDSLLMNAARIDAFNRQILRKGLVEEIENAAPIVKADKLKRQIEDCYDMAKNSSKYLQDGSPITDKFWQELHRQLNLTSIKSSQNTRFAFPIRFCNQRLIPYSAILTRSALDLDFDRVQNSGFDIGEPLIIYHDSRDGKWVFGAGRASSGWFLKADLAFYERDDWLMYQQNKSFIVSTRDKSDLYLDEACTQFYGIIRLGTKLPIRSERDKTYELILPSKESAFIYKSDVHPGFVPYNARKVYELAFTALNAPYGWGDLNAEYDCSGLLKQLFQCFGIFLPRNGGAQYSASSPLYEFPSAEGARERELQIAQRALPAQTLLRLPGHIMLYLGSVEGKSYALHALWGVSRAGINGEDEVIAANKTLVSDLYLGDGSKRKSLLLRLTGIGAIHNEK